MKYFFTKSEYLQEHKNWKTCKVMTSDKLLLQTDCDDGSPLYRSSWADTLLSVWVDQVLRVGKNLHSTKEINRSKIIARELFHLEGDNLTFVDFFASL